MYSGVFRAFLLENDTVRAVRVNQNSKAAPRRLNNEPKLAIKLRKAEGGCRFTFAVDSTTAEPGYLFLPVSVLYAKLNQQLLPVTSYLTDRNESGINHLM